jgi:hypothetical protein
LVEAYRTLMRVTIAQKTIETVTSKKNFSLKERGIFKIAL